MNNPSELLVVAGSSTPPSPEGRPLLSTCAACGSVAFRWLFHKKGHQFWKCQGCGMERQFPLPKTEQLKIYYDDSYSQGMYLEFAEASAMKQQTAALRFRTIRHVCNPERWLDIGCGDGAFLQELSTHGIDAAGIDVSKVAVAKAKARGLHAVCATAEEYRPAQRYSTITAFDVIEHVSDPVQFIHSAYRLLKMGGTLILTTPNLRSVSRTLMGRHWFFYIPEEHLFYFSPRSLGVLLERHGFDVLSCGPVAKPLTFDYSLTQFELYNPWIYRLLRACAWFLPIQIRQLAVPLYIGEMLAIAKKRPHIWPTWTGDRKSAAESAAARGTRYGN